MTERAGTTKEKLLAFRPRTPLGERLWKIRARILASGEPTLGWAEVERELAERRGEVAADEPQADLR